MMPRLDSTIFMVPLVGITALPHAIHIVALSKSGASIVSFPNPPKDPMALPHAIHIGTLLIFIVGAAVLDRVIDIDPMALHFSLNERPNRLIAVASVYRSLSVPYIVVATARPSESYKVKNIHPPR